MQSTVTTSYYKEYNNHFPFEQKISVVMMRIKFVCFFTSILFCNGGKGMKFLLSTALVLVFMSAYSVNAAEKCKAVYGDG